MIILLRDIEENKLNNSVFIEAQCIVVMLRVRPIRTSDIEHR